MRTPPVGCGTIDAMRRLGVDIGGVIIEPYAALLRAG